MTPFPMTGTVYGVLLNFQAERDALGERMSLPPYQAPPRAPVLYIKPANTCAETRSILVTWPVAPSG